MKGPDSVRVLAILQARTSSTRLPGKVLADLQGAPMLLRQIERIERARLIDRLILATSDDGSDDALAALVGARGLTLYRGSLDDVLARFAGAAALVASEHVVRLTGDCPLTDPDVIDAVIAHHLVTGADITTNAVEPTFPDGLDVEVVRSAVLKEAAAEASAAFEREHVTQFVYRRPQRYRIVHYRQPDDLSSLRWTVDETKDLELVRAIYGALYPSNPAFGTRDVLRLLAQRGEIAGLNAQFERNEGLARSLAREADASSPATSNKGHQMSQRYAGSEAIYQRARKTIPLGAQTFSKSVTQFPLGAAPLFAARAQGSRIWDVDGNEYVDFVNGLASITLGYCDPDVNAAVIKQIGEGTIFSLSHEIETRVAERIVDMVPSAEMVRFGKNGSDATSGAIRVARAATGREMVLVAGYHGWQDWYIGSTTRDKGVPASTKALTQKFAYNDVASLDARLDECSGKVAAIILEPMNIEAPKPGYLEAVRERATRHGCVLVFDETITGFRYAKGGAQELFGVSPDLTTLGKGLANGFPLAAVCGRRDLMMEMEEIFFSFTMGGETVSLAAAEAVLAKYEREPVIETLRQRGRQILKGVAERIERHGAAAFLRISGDPTWSFLSIADSNGLSSFEIKTLWEQEMFARGILTIGTHNMSYAHSEADVDRLLNAYDEVIPVLARAVADRSVRQLLKCEPLVPLFKVR